MSTQVIYGVQLQPCGQICYFTAGEWPDLSAGDRVVVRINRGEALAEIVRVLNQDQLDDYSTLSGSADNGSEGDKSQSCGKEQQLHENAPADRHIENNERADDNPVDEKKHAFIGEPLQWEVWDDDEQPEEGAAIEPGLCLDPASPAIQAILRPAAPDDLKRAESNRELSREANIFCMQRARYHNLDMKMVQAEYLLDGSKIIFYFTAPNRIDFRELVKDLVKEFRTRIELRQIGVRHETQMIGATGNCGMVCCCRRYMRHFAPVTIKMAKEQNLFLNPAKISGTCGRLLCCLAFEQEGYEEFHRRCPKMSKKYITNRGVVKVLRSSIFRNTLSLLPEEGEEFEVTLDEWQAMDPVRQGQVQQPKKSQTGQAAAMPESDRPAAGLSTGKPQRESRRSGGGEQAAESPAFAPAAKRKERDERIHGNKPERKDRDDKQANPRKEQAHGAPTSPAPEAGRKITIQPPANGDNEPEGAFSPSEKPQKEDAQSAGLSRFLAATGEEES